MFFFFFSSRRRHTRLVSDWSSDVCSSDLARDYDVWIGDEAWEVDYYLHENPELKQAAYVWLTDFVGWLPMPALGERDVRSEERRVGKEWRCGGAGEARRNKWRGGDGRRRR